VVGTVWKHSGIAVQLNLNHSCSKMASLHTNKCSNANLDMIAAVLVIIFFGLLLFFYCYFGIR